MGPDDLDHVILELYTDADWNGDGGTTKSTDGCWVEVSGFEGRSFPILWHSTRQTFTSSSSAESETVGASKGIRHEGIPIQALLEAMLGRKAPLRCYIESTQATLAIARGYSKRLRNLSRTHRVSLGVLNELITDPELQITVVYANTLMQKAYIFTKALSPAAFVRARELIGMRPMHLAEPVPPAARS